MFVCRIAVFFMKILHHMKKGKRDRKETKDSDEEKEAEGRKELINTSKSIKPFVSTVILGFKQQ